MNIYERLFSKIGAQRSVSGIGFLLLIGLIAWSVFISDGSSATLIQNIVIVGMPGLILIYGGHWLNQTELHPDTYKHVAKWCNIGVVVMNSLLLLVLLIGGDPEIFQQMLLLTGIGGAAGFGIGVQQAKAYTHARELEERNEELKRHKKIIGSIKDGVYVMDNEYRFIMVNRAYEEMTGRSKEDLIGKPATEVVSEEIAENSREKLQNLEPGESATLTAEMENPNGKNIIGESKFMPLTDENGNMTGKMGIVRDITERKRLEEKLRKERDQSWKMTQSMIDAVENYAIFRLEPDGTVATWNKGAENLKGYTEDEIVGENFSKFYTEEARREGTPEENLENARENGKTRDWGWRVRKDGTRFWADVTITATRNEEGELTGFIKITEDITEKHRQRQEMERRLEEFGSLVSHDLKNPLNIAKGYLDLAEDSKEEEDFQKVKASLDNMSQIIEDMRIITLQTEDIHKQKLSLERVFIDSHEFTRTADSSYTIEDVEIKASDSAIKRLLGNLIENSIEHNEEPLHIEAGSLEDEDGFYYEDDGEGIDDSTKEQVLEKGFTTSEKGSGLGLYIIKRVAELHDWDMEIKDAENGGARFEFHT